MSVLLTAEKFLQKQGHLPVLDVRSPGEYHSGHIPGSINLPILDDGQRAEVGTIYKKSGKIMAIDKGLEIVGPKLKKYAQKARELSIDETVMLYCWRGGMRSASMAWLFETAGLQCYLLEGGYKAYRAFGRDQLSLPANTIIIGGYTGCGKTKVLRALKKKGEQILDIEKEAHHRGSSFGSIGQAPQLSNEQFENSITNKWKSFNLDQPIWLEDESRILGTNHIPEPLYNKIRESKVIKLSIPKALRAENLLEDYAHLDKKQLEMAIRRIERKLGGQNFKAALESLEKEDFHTVAELSLHYYDKTYDFGLSKRREDDIIELEFDTIDPDIIAEKILNTINKQTAADDIS